MPSPEKAEFFTKNRETLETLVERENSRRNAQGFDSINEEEFDQAMDEIMAWVESGNRITAYKFTLPKRPLAASPVEPKKQNPVIAPKSLQCSIQKCANGFVISIENSEGGGGQYIFKSPKELMNVFSEVLFKDSEATKDHTIPESLPVEVKVPKAIKNELKAIRTH